MAGKGIVYKGPLPKEACLVEESPKAKKVKTLIEEIPQTIPQQTQKEALKTVEHIISNVRIGKAIEEEPLKKVIKQMVEEVISNQEAMLNLVKIKSHDEYTFAHSTNVCTLAILLGIKRNFNKAEIEEMAIGGMLHDVGKVKIKEEILLKPNKLTIKEYEEVRKHPLYGYEILNESKLSELPKVIAAQHHERIHGQGYPQGLSRDKIHPLARLVALVNLYDSLTTDKPYRSKFLPHDAMRLIISQSGRDFPVEDVKKFVEDMSIYPMGSFVRLNTGEIGVITRINRYAVIRPWVKILLNAKRGILYKPIEVNLIKDKERFIVNCVGEEVMFE
ncbi:MAG: HD-GYP domain-containing protein [Nitrospirota bacterium]